MKDKRIVLKNVDLRPMFHDALLRAEHMIQSALRDRSHGWKSVYQLQEIIQAAHNSYELMNAIDRCLPTTERVFVKQRSLTDSTSIASS